MAQKTASCQFCDSEDNDMKWKCVNCNLFLCDECNRKIHTKIKSSKKHQVLEVKEFCASDGNETIRKVNLGNIQCTNHKEEKVIIYCRKCNQLLCSECLLEGHQEHDLAKIKDVYREKKDMISKKYEDIEKMLSFYLDCCEDIKKTKSVGLSKYKEIRRNVEEKVKVIKQDTDEQAKFLLKELDSLWLPYQHTVVKKETEIQKQLTLLQQRKSDIDGVFDSHDASTIFEVAECLSEELPIRISDCKISKLCLAFCDCVDINCIDLGSVYQIPELKVLRTYDSTVLNISILKMVSDEYAMVCFNPTCFQFFDFYESFCITSKTLDIPTNVIDMTITKNNAILLTSDAEVLSLSTDGKLEAVFLVRPFVPRGIHATERNIILGFIEECDPVLPLSINSRRGIMIVDMDGRIMRTFEYDNDNNRLVSLPDVITTNINGDICIVDSLSLDFDGQIVTLGAMGQLKWIYNGHSSVNIIKKFAPYDIVTTKTGLILLADRDSHAIHMLSINGEFVSCLGGKHGISYPLCLNIDYNGQLQIGCERNEAIEESAKLHIVNLM